MASSLPSVSLSLVDDGEKTHRRVATLLIVNDEPTGLPFDSLAEQTLLSRRLINILSSTLFFRYKHHSFFHVTLMGELLTKILFLSLSLSLLSALFLLRSPALDQRTHQFYSFFLPVTCLSLFPLSPSTCLYISIRTDYSPLFQPHPPHRMHRLVSALVLLSLSSSTTTTTVNGQSSATAATGGSVPTTEHTPSSCLYCQTKACRCPSTRSILNCSSYLLNLTFASSTCAPTHVWETVDFSLRHLESFDSYQLLSLRMHRLLLRSNSMATIDDHAFDSIADVLAELDLQTNHLTNVSSNWLSSNMTQLRTLNLASNRIESLVLLDAVLLPALQELNLSHNRINVFPDEIRQWTSLTTLDLSFNRLASIPRFALTGLQNLTWLSVASNRNLTCK